jgi:hypothetical protein
MKIETPGIMKSYRLVMLFLLFTFNSIGQADSSAILIEDAIRSLDLPNTILYIDSAIAFYTPLSEMARKGCISGRNDTLKVSFCLSKNELHFLDKEFKKSIPYQWKDNMFTKSIRISKDSTTFWLKKIRSSHLFNPKTDTRYFHFSRIIYIRNNSIALFRFAEMYGHSGGNDYIFIYTKKENSWRRLMSMDMGAW